MQRVRVTVKHNPVDPVDDLRCAARVPPGPLGSLFGRD